MIEHPDDLSGLTDSEELIEERRRSVTDEQDPREGQEAMSMGLPTLDHRERSLPIRQGDLTKLLAAEEGLSPQDRERVAHFGQLLGAMFHAQFFPRLRELKERYAPLDPDSEYAHLDGFSSVLDPVSCQEFLRAFEFTLERANYSRLDQSVIEQAVSAPNEAGLTYVPDFSLFDVMRVYVRGFTQIQRVYRGVSSSFRLKTVTLDAYQRLVIALKFHEGQELGPLVRSDVLYLRMFKDVPHVDMEMHLPEQGTRVRMRTIDKAQIASPLFTGIPAVLAKYLLAASISRVALLGMLFAPVSAGVNSFFGFHRAKRTHLHSMIHRLYYMTLANNASVLTRLIDSAEEEEYKEAMLAYFFLWRGRDGGGVMSQEWLDHSIEEYLREKTQVSINFEIGDALDKLHRFGLVLGDSREDLRAVPLDQAIQLLSRWEEYAKIP